MAAQAVCSANIGQPHTLPEASCRDPPRKTELTCSQGSGNLRTAVQLPEGEDLQEWIAVHGEWSKLLFAT